ncbi:MAG: adventurous gliding motility protein CglE [Deltaproteobacteria bacterium]|nr:adventurous gliding motility protein CglE [Deltaproteobacteria bacterium]
MNAFNTLRFRRRSIFGSQKPSCLHSFLLFAFLAAAALPGLAQRSSNVAEPQEGEEVKGDAGVAEIHEVERGLFVSVDAGINYYLDLSSIPTFAPLNKGWLKPGTRLGIRVGYDVLNNLNLDVFLLSQWNKNDLDNTAVAAGFLSGDLFQLTPGVGARFSFITTDRLHIFARAGVGFVFWFPNELVKSSGALLDVGALHVDGSVGVEYYTKLRHLSIGVEVAAQGLLLPMAFGFQVYPTIKYTF